MCPDASPLPAACPVASAADRGSRGKAQPAALDLFIAPLTWEEPCDLQVFLTHEGVTYGGAETSSDRDVDGILWERWGGTPTATSERRWSEHHPVRQYASMERLLCAGCGRETDHEPGLGRRWILPADPAASVDWTQPLQTTTPPLCSDCALTKPWLCERLRDGFVELRVREAELVGVRGTLYSPTAPPRRREFVPFDHPDIRRIVAQQLVREVRGAVVVRLGAPPTRHTLSCRPS
ncbi:hypothetical protein [Streptomyces lydicus]|uniref:hypothetical protein n=1 Tax=Streptomyces lydicus TaxID=47763 RepID=UPI001010D59C|nr:hypothetical protein [Streptomyces lydicus]MCZ1012222.1 hypothetical protein [Streptomyces lydicus]